MQREPLPLRQPEQPNWAPAIHAPPDIHFSVAWRYLFALLSMWCGTAIYRSDWWRIASLGFLGGVLWRYARTHEPAHPHIVFCTIADARFAPAMDGFTIAQISDIHLGQPHSDVNLQWSIQQLSRYKPDLIVLTGDLVNDRPALTRLSNYLRRMHAPCGVYAIAGNHDYTEEVDDVRHALEFVGIPLLQNQGLLIHHNGVPFWLAGVDDVWHGQMDIASAVKSAPPDVPIILLAHSPDAILEACQYPAIVLQLSGHVHGGHVRLPALGPLAMPRFGRHYTHGTHRVGATHLHVSIGLSGRPFRIGNTPELTILRCFHRKD
jgi:predicted MPP superfamily phosphohydrolase